MVGLTLPLEARMRLNVPFAPGIIGAIGIGEVKHMQPGVPVRLEFPAGTIALDGERELAFDQSDDVTITLVKDAFRTVNVSGIMNYASKQGLMKVN